MQSSLASTFSITLTCLTEHDLESFVGFHVSPSETFPCSSSSFFVVETTNHDKSSELSNAVSLAQVFIRDFVPSALAFMMENEPEVVKNFLLQTLQLQSWDKTMDCFRRASHVLPRAPSVCLNSQLSFSQDKLPA